MKNANNKQKGVTLVEVLLAMAILSFVMVTVMYALVYRIHSFKKTRERTTAVIIAESAIEDINKYPSSSIPAAQKFFIAKNGGKLIRSNTKPNQSNFTELYEVNTTSTANSSFFNMLYDIQVNVRYAYLKKSGNFLGHVTLNTQRGR